MSAKQVSRNTVGKGKIACNKQFLLFPQFSTLLENFPPFLPNLSVVLCLSSIIHCALSTISLNFFSSKTVGPIWNKLGRNIPWEMLFKKLFTEFDSIKNLGCHGNQMKFFKQCFRNLLLWNG